MKKDKKRRPFGHNRRLEDIEEKDQSVNAMNELMSDKAVYRTAPAIPGLLIIHMSAFMKNCQNYISIYYCYLIVERRS